MRLSLLFILPLLFTTWQTSFAATVDCSKIKTDAERLACFDNTSKPNKPPVSAETKGNGQKSEWEFFTNKSDWDDSVDYDIVLLSDNQVRANYGNHTFISIWISCRKSTMVMYFFTKGLLGGHGDRGTVRYRLDKEQASELEMELASTKHRLGLWSSEESIPFIKEMFGHDKMLVQIQDYGGEPLTMRFSIKGIEEAIKPVRKACKW